ncbi:PH domain-containing protein [Roseivirga spongicola]|uniref:PH domain-containing protein n=1 Tax=Roseivirga spongicola TaxID=333140 RepID=UPI002AC8AE16|nr:PH domain-containing protein [Roseivirga spongicola]WPZ12231.1 PH domain-containing protein [Roseivirga spongicola]
MTNTFQNLSVNLAELPEVKQSEFHGIEKKYLKVSLISRSLWFLALIISAACIILFNDDIDKGVFEFGVSIGPILLFWVFSLVYAIKAFPRKRYSLREKDIIYTKGLLWQTRTSIPFNRIQHAEVKQGPIERMFSLHSLKVFTAGGDSSDLVIPGLEEENASRIKEYIMGKTALDGTDQQ